MRWRRVVCALGLHILMPWWQVSYRAVVGPPEVTCSVCGKRDWEGG